MKKLLLLLITIASCNTPKFTIDRVDIGNNLFSLYMVDGNETIITTFVEGNEQNVNYMVEKTHCLQKKHSRCCITYILDTPNLSFYYAVLSNNEISQEGNISNVEHGNGKDNMNMVLNQLLEDKFLSKKIIESINLQKLIVEQKRTKYFTKTKTL